ncbi:MAG: ATP-binding cassette domain-containing protein [Rhodobacteraceae bacterium]|nr:ATP-binding cassette domain-containing protein [Paracoccaceae bacterium]MCF8521033.1 ATP-binding cassette domain-containing protein [Paracoccaceae bacterium]
MPASDWRHRAPGPVLHKISSGRITVWPGGSGSGTSACTEAASRSSIPFRGRDGAASSPRRWAKTIWRGTFQPASGTEVIRITRFPIDSSFAIPSRHQREYPHQLSGGMKQRIVIAMALAADPDLIIADEPTTALDVTIQAQIIQIMVDLVRDRGLALILITHDMGVVAQACDRVVVLYAERVAEMKTTQAIFATPRHPYTASLIACQLQEARA